MAPQGLSSYDEGSKEFTLTFRRAALGPGLKPAEEMCLDTGGGPVKSVTFSSDGAALKVVFKLRAPAVWNSGWVYSEEDRTALWDLTFKPGP